MASPETLEKVRGIVASLFNLNPEEVSADSSSETISAWDSMGQLTVILELEQEFGIAMTHDRVERMTSVGAIAALIDEASVAGVGH